MRHRGLCSRIPCGSQILDKVVTKPLQMDRYHSGQMFNRCDDVPAKYRDRSRCCRGDHRSYFLHTPPQPRAGPWHRHTAGDECFLRLGPPFRGQYRPGCSEKHSGAVSINPLSACSTIPQLVLLCLVSKPSPARIPNQPAPWHRTITETVLGRFPALGCLYFVNQGCDEVFLVKVSSRGTTWSPWPAKGEPLPSYDSPSHHRKA